MAKILIIEDDRLIAKMLSRRLQKRGFQIDVAENGLLGIEKAVHDHPDLILMDLYMPVMNGYHATRVLRGRGYQGQIVVVSASAMDSDRRQAFAAGCDYFIPKPIDRHFEAMIEKLLINRLEDVPDIGG